MNVKSTYFLYGMYSSKNRMFLSSTGKGFDGERQEILESKRINSTALFSIMTAYDRKQTPSVTGTSFKLLGESR